MDVGRCIRRRAGMVFLACAVLFVALTYRLFEVQVLGHDRFRALRERQSSSFVATESPRGTVLDRGGHTLAVSVPVSSVFADPKRTPPGSAGRLAEALSLDAAFVRERLSRDKRFVWLKRRVSPKEEKAVRALGIDGVGYRREFLRVYPCGRLAGHVLGVVNIDQVGGEGIERSMDRWLRGHRKRGRVQVDALRRLATPAPEAPAGADVRLTLDAQLQWIVEQELDATMEKWTPKWACVVVVDPDSGSVLAIANRPAFDPNDVGGAPADARRNRSITDPYEPGSTMKPFVVAAALEEGLVAPETEFSCNGAWKFGPRLLHDHKSHGTVTLVDVIALSCNVGAAQVGGLHLGAERLHDYMRKFGFGRAPGIELPYGSAGQFKRLDRWTPYYTVSSVSVGHEISVTPLHLANALSVIANGGVWRPARIVDRVVSADGRTLRRTERDAETRVLSRRTAEKVRAMLVETVERGTGRRARVEGVKVAGKTGTSQKFDPEIRAYSHEKYRSSFVCFAPAGPGETARMVVVVVVDEPQGGHYGGLVAAPLAQRILSRGLPLLR